jgi:hypothetical protein
MRPVGGTLPQWGLATRCVGCNSPILIVWKQGDGGWWEARAIEVPSWDGSPLYKPGVHIFHGRLCTRWRKVENSVKEYEVLPEEGTWIHVC